MTGGQDSEDGDEEVEPRVLWMSRLLAVGRKCGKSFWQFLSGQLQLRGQENWQFGDAHMDPSCRGRYGGWRHILGKQAINWVLQNKRLAITHNGKRTTKVLPRLTFERLDNRCLWNYCLVVIDFQSLIFFVSFQLLPCQPDRVRFLGVNNNLQLLAQHNCSRGGSMSVTNRRDIGIQTHTFPALETRKLDSQGPQNSSGTTNRDHQWLLKTVRKS